MTNLLNRTLLALAGTLVLAACGGTKVLKEPVEMLPLDAPLAVASDEYAKAQLDWVIFRDGPGTWARDADWDQYLMQFTNRSEQPITIIRVQVYDSLNTEISAMRNRKDLVKASKQTKKRYKGEDIRVKAGISGGALAAAGVGTYVAGAGLGAAALGGSSAAASAAGVAAVGAIVVAPVLVVGGINRGLNGKEVSEEIVARSSDMPYVVEAGTSVDLTAFFPLAPSPRSIRIVYRDANANIRTLSVDTGTALDGLHIVPREED